MTEVAHGLNVDDALTLFYDWQEVKLNERIKNLKRRVKWYKTRCKNLKAETKRILAETRGMTDG
jgi:hypothetical protein